MDAKNSCFGCSYCGTLGGSDYDLYCWFDAHDPRCVGADYEERDCGMECPLEGIEAAVV